MSDYTPPANGFRTFVIVWITQSISVFGSALTFFAMNIWLVTVRYPAPEQKAQLALALSAVSLAFAVPTLVLAPLAGAFADRHDRRRIMIGMDFLNALFSLGLVALILSGRLEVWSLVAVIALFAAVGAFHGSAFDTSYAMLVSEKQLPRANGMMQTIWSLSGILSPALAAAIISLPSLARQGRLSAGLNETLAPLRDGSVLAIGLDALTFLISAVTLLFLFIPSPARHDLLAGAGPKKSVWADVREGAQYIWHRRALLWLLGTFTMANFAAGPLGVFLPLLVRFDLSADWGARGYTVETALALLSSTEGVAGLTGGVLISLWGGLKRRRVYGVLGAMLVASTAQIALGFSGALYVSAALIFVMLAMTPIMNAHSQSIWQSQTPHELQGRVFAVRRVIAQFTWPLSTAMAGWLGGLFRPGAVLSALGIIFFVFVLGQFFNPHLLRVEDKQWLDRQAASKAAGME